MIILSLSQILFRFLDLNARQTGRGLGPRICGGKDSESLRKCDCGLRGFSGSRLRIKKCTFIACPSLNTGICTETGVSFAIGKTGFVIGAWRLAQVLFKTKVLISSINSIKQISIKLKVIYNIINSFKFCHCQ